MNCPSRRVCRWNRNFGQTTRNLAVITDGAHVLVAAGLLATNLNISGLSAVRRQKCERAR
eukprot:scaffold365961_cov18-Prasinocladus_malaysianus.AAC.1